MHSSGWIKYDFFTGDSSPLDSICWMYGGFNPPHIATASIPFSDLKKGFFVKMQDGSGTVTVACSYKLGEGHRAGESVFRYTGCSVTNPNRSLVFGTQVQVNAIIISATDGASPELVYAANYACEKFATELKNSLILGPVGRFFRGKNAVEFELIYQPEEGLSIPEYQRQLPNYPDGDYGTFKPERTVNILGVAGADGARGSGSVPVSGLELQPLRPLRDAQEPPKDGLPRMR